jgi:hypothetical protein
VCLTAGTDRPEVLPRCGISLVSSDAEIADALRDAHELGFPCVVPVVVFSRV